MELILAGIIAFASTNIDDIFVLMLFFGNKKVKKRDIFIGQFLGIGALIVISFIGSFADLFFDKAYIGLLGLLPIFLGVKGLLSYFRSTHLHEEAKEDLPNKGSVFTVASVTIANGGDNIGIYIPLFATLSFGEKLGMVMIFVIMTAVWCLIGKYLSKHPIVAKAVDKYGHWATPIVLILLGVYILYESGSFHLLWGG